MPDMKDFGAVLLASLCLAVASGVTSCGVKTSVSRDETLLSSRPAPREQCGIMWKPRTLPALSQLLDSTALRSGVSQVAMQRGMTDPTTFVTFSIGIDRDGMVERLEPIDWYAPDGWAYALQSVIREHMKKQPGGDYSVRLRIDGGDIPRIRLGRSELCRPQSRHSFEVRAPALNGPVRPDPVQLLVHVDSKGRIAGTRVLRSSGDAELDRWVEKHLQRATYAPALIDGVPVAMSYEQTVRFKSR